MVSLPGQPRGISAAGLGPETVCPRWLFINKSAGKAPGRSLFVFSIGLFCISRDVCIPSWGFLKRLAGTGA